MPSVSENKQEWNTTYAWERDGDEWSDPWGGPRAQWFGALLPRIFPFLGAGVRVLEIAPGRGRWTQFLKDQCESLVAVDLSPTCIEHCQRQFGHCANVEMFVNDGLTLPMVADASIDFVFSFDSLVHAEAEALESYIRELSRKLKPGGGGCIHHSNLGGMRRSALDKIQRRLSGKVVEQHWRSPSMSADRMRQLCSDNAMTCVFQEIIPWGEIGWPAPIDCLSTIVNQAGLPSSVFQNDRFMKEAQAIKRLAALKTGAGTKQL